MFRLDNNGYSWAQEYCNQAWIDFDGTIEKMSNEDLEADEAPFKLWQKLRPKVPKLGKLSDPSVSDSPFPSPFGILYEMVIWANLEGNVRIGTDLWNHHNGLLQIDSGKLFYRFYFQEKDMEKKLAEGIGFFMGVKANLARIESELDVYFEQILKPVLEKRIREVLYSKKKVQEMKDKIHSLNMGG